MKRSISEADMAYDEAWMENLKKLAVALSESDDSFKEMVETGKIVIN
jgi:hypothetical protein